MANVDLPNGFQPYRHIGGGAIRANEFALASAYGSSIKRGDAVVITSGKLAIAADNSAAILGIFAGCKYINPAGEVIFSPQWPAGQTTLGSVDATAFVYDDPDITYKVQVDTGSTFAIASHVGVSYDIELDHAGSTTTGQSGMELDLNDTGTGQFTIMGLINEPGNEVGVNAKVEVMNNVPVFG
jgi:hypothetical protein